MVVTYTESWLAWREKQATNSPALLGPGRRPKSVWLESSATRLHFRRVDHSASGQVVKLTCYHFSSLLMMLEGGRECVLWSQRCRVRADGEGRVYVRRWVGRLLGTVRRPRHSARGGRHRGGRGALLDPRPVHLQGQTLARRLLQSVLRLHQRLVINDLSLIVVLTPNV